MPSRRQPRAQPLAGSYPGQPRRVPFIERIIYYILLSELFARVVLELALGLYSFSLGPQKLAIFYCLMAVDYACQTPALSRFRFKINLNSFPFLLLTLMTLHGAVAGLAWGNPLPKLLTDTLPLAVCALNVALLNREGATTGFSFRRLRRVVIVYSLLMVACGALAVTLGRPSTVSLGGAGGTPLCLTVLLVWLITKRAVTALDVLLLVLLVGPTVPNINRTTFVVFVLAFIGLVLPRLIRSGRQLYFFGLVAAAVAVASPFVVTPDSPLMRRLEGITKRLTTDTNEESGSLQERAAEWQAINEKLRELGPTAEMLGYGAGGVYSVEFSGGQVLTNYSHAHFSWALFRLRFGNVGFVYLALFFGCLLARGATALMSSTPGARLILLLNFWGVVFCFTYAFFNFEIAGLQFADTTDIEEEPDAAGAEISSLFTEARPPALKVG